MIGNYSILISTKEAGQKCPLMEKCYRYKTKPSEYRQSYFIGIPYDFKKKKCEYFYKD